MDRVKRKKNKTRRDEINRIDKEKFKKMKG